MVPTSRDNAYIDPYESFRFRLSWNGRYVAGFSEVSSLKRTTEVVRHRESAGQKPSESVNGQHGHEAVVLKRGITDDDGFHNWANRAGDAGPAANPEYPRGNLRTDLILQLHNESGQIVITYTLFRCWVSQYEAVRDLDANANAVAIELIKLENEGWQRDDAVIEPTEPGFDEPV